jgi:hypothetical protein
MGIGNGGAPRFIDLLIAASPMERRKVTVCGQDIYFKPLTRKQLADSMPKDGVPRDPDYAGLFMLVASARAEDGSPLFETTDIEALRTKVSLAILHELEAAMLGVVAPSVKEAEQELDANPTSGTA